MSLLLYSLFAISAGLSFFSLYCSLRDYFPQMRELFSGSGFDALLCHESYAVWPTRLRLNGLAFPGVQPAMFRRRPRPIARKASSRAVAAEPPMLTRRLRYTAAPERVYLLS